MKISEAKLKKLQAGKSIQSEDDLQKSCIDWFRAQHSKLYYRLMSIPNGGLRDRKTVTNKKTGKVVTYSPAAKLLKDTGLLPGAWDLFLSIPKGKYCGLFIEAKVGDNTLSDEQKDFKGANEEDYCFIAFYTLEEFIAAIKWYLSL